ncbi:unnamed protein product, partial [Didymodactylos carnosus]
MQWKRGPPPLQQKDYHELDSEKSPEIPGSLSSTSTPITLNPLQPTATQTNSFDIGYCVSDSNNDVSISKRDITRILRGASQVVNSQSAVNKILVAAQITFLCGNQVNIFVISIQLQHKRRKRLPLVTEAPCDQQLIITCYAVYPANCTTLTCQAAYGQLILNSIGNATNISLSFLDSTNQPVNVGVTLSSISDI